MTPSFYSWMQARTQVRDHSQLADNNWKLQAVIIKTEESICKSISSGNPRVVQPIG